MFNQLAQMLKERLGEMQGHPAQQKPGQRQGFVMPPQNQPQGQLMQRNRSGLAFPSPLENEMRVTHDDLDNFRTADPIMRARLQLQRPTFSGHANTGDQMSTVDPQNQGWGQGSNYATPIQGIQNPGHVALQGGGSYTNRVQPATEYNLNTQRKLRY